MNCRPLLRSGANTILPAVATASDRQSGTFASIGGRTDTKRKHGRLGSWATFLLFESSVITIVGAILNPNSPGGDIRAADLQSAGRALGLQVQIVHARNAQEMMPRLTGLCKKNGAVIVGSDPS